MALGLPDILGGTAKQGVFGSGASKKTSMPPGTWETVGPYGGATRDLGLLINQPPVAANKPWSYQSYLSSQGTGAVDQIRNVGKGMWGEPSDAQIRNIIGRPPPPAPTGYSMENDPVLQMLRAQLGQFNTQNQLAQQQTRAQQQQAAALAAWNKQQIQAQYGTDSRLLDNERYRNVDLSSQLANQLFGIQQEHFGATFEDLQRQIDYANQVRTEYNRNSRAMEGFSGRGRDLTVDELRKIYDIDVQEYNQALKYINEQRGFAGQEYEQETKYSNALRDFFQRQYNEGITYSQEMRDYITQQFKLAQQQAEFEDERGRRAAKSDAITRGAFTSEGYGQTREDLLTQLKLATSGNRLSLNKGLGEVGERDRGLTLARDKGLTDVEKRNQELASRRDQILAQLANQQEGAYQELNRDYTSSVSGQNQAQLAYEKQIQDLRYGRTQANMQADKVWNDVGYQRGELQRQQDAEYYAFQNQQQMFASLADDYGIRQEDLQRVMQQGINRAGMDYNATMQKITADYASGDAARRAQAAALQAQILQYGR